jgi:LCP family protein required for cell wall assembly
MKINLLEKIPEEKIGKRKRPLIWKSAIVLVIMIPLFFIQTTFLKTAFNPFLKVGAVFESFKFENITEWVSQIGKLIRSDDKLLDGEKEGRINFLLLGMGGAGHEGAYLTDTIILAILETKDKKIAMISIPRDLVVPMSGYGWRKINNVNAFAETKERGSGGEAAQEVVGQVFDLPIHYYIRVDFKGFKKLIDKLGGLSVYIDRSFTDFQYPTDDFKYQVVSFREGWQVMDGETALKFVRSRHGTNGEASDFARSRRQQKILIALKEKILSFSTLLNPLKLQNIYETMKDSIDTNMEMWEMVRLRRLANDADTENIVHQVISADPGGLLVAANVDGAYILEPRTGNFDEIQILAKNIFNAESQMVFEKKPEPIRVEIQNGTKKTGLAARTAEIIKKMDFEIVKIGNAKEQNYERTIIYDLTQGQKNDKLNLLREKLDADISLSIPSWMTSSITPTEVTIFAPSALAEEKQPIDFLIILGKNVVY